jgi:Ca-activated chloride channel homolog
VAKVKPLKTDSALRYLWARHRITILSDYNKLRSNDRRVQEVIDLGLKYNLLTAYTSFVAIDTEARNSEGQPTAVKQPLPLPQGVSNYAVGGMAASQAIAPYALTVRKAGPGEYETKDARDKVMKEETAKKTLQIRDVTISEGLSKETVLNVLQKHLKDLERCYAANLPGSIVMRLAIAPDGTVRYANVISSAAKNNSLEQCIIEALKKCRFPVTQDGREAHTTITLVFG